MLASRIARLPGPVDGVATSLDNDAAWRGDALRARNLGFAGKFCIHPRQIAGVEAAFVPGEKEIEWAREVLSAAERSQGSVTVTGQGEMVDAPVVARARRLIEAVEDEQA